MQEDWRLNGQERYLFGERLFSITSVIYKEESEADHMHCDFCWAKISKFPDDLQKGYCTFDGHFVCEECFNDFREQFQWTIDERIKNFNDFQEKFEKLNKKIVVARKTKNLSNEKKCVICKKIFSNNDTDEFCLCTEDENICLCCSCADDFAYCFNWKSR